VTRTLAVAKAERKALDLVAARMHKAKDRAKLAALRLRIGELKAAKKARTKALASIAREGLAKVRQRTRDLRAALIEASKAAREVSRYIAPGAKVKLTKARAAALAMLAEEHGGLIAGAHMSLEDERKEQRWARAMDRSNANRTKSRTTAGARARLSESDDEVRANLDPQLVRIFDRVKGKIAGNARKSRTEAFLEYAQQEHVLHEHGWAADETLPSEAELRRQEAALRDDLSHERTYGPKATRARLEAETAEENANLAARELSRGSQVPEMTAKKRGARAARAAAAHISTGKRTKRPPADDIPF